MSNTDSQARRTDQELPRVGDTGQKSGRKVSSVRHHHIADWLRERIESEELPPGARVPTARELAATFGVAGSTHARRPAFVGDSRSPVPSGSSSGVTELSSRPLGLADVRFESADRDTPRAHDQ